MLVGRVLRENSFYGMEQIVRLVGCRVLGLEQSFSNDALNYFVERLDPATSRSALIGVRQAKRDRALQRLSFHRAGSGWTRNRAEARIPLCLV
jgi:hypothetical protein